jgi:hypothetical protein
MLTDKFFVMAYNSLTGNNFDKLMEVVKLRIIYMENSVNEILDGRAMSTLEPVEVDLIEWFRNDHDRMCQFYYRKLLKSQKPRE